MLVPLSIDEEVGTLAFVPGSHERVVDILVDELLRSGHLGRKPCFLALLGKEVGYLHQFIIVIIVGINELMYQHLASIGILFPGLESLVLTLPNEPARSAQFIVRHECKHLTLTLSEGEGSISLGQIAVVAPPDGVGIVVGYGLVFLSWIEMEDTLCVTLKGFFSQCHCLVGWCERIFGLAHLHYGATAVPSVGWIVFLPERV